MRLRTVSAYIQPKQAGGFTFSDVEKNRVNTSYFRSGSLINGRDGGKKDGQIPLTKIQIKKNKKNKSYSFIAYVFGFWVGAIYAVAIGGRIVARSDGSGKFDIMLLLVALLWPLLYFVFSRYSFFPARIRNGILFSLFGFLLFSFFSSFVSPVPIVSVSFVGLSVISIWISLQFVSSMDSEQLEIGLKVYAFIITGILVVFSIYDYVPGDRLGNGKQILNPNSIGVVAISAALSTMAIRMWLARYIMLFMILVILYLTGSRASLLSTLFGLFIIGMQRTSSSRIGTKVLVLLTIIISMVLFLVFWNQVWPIIEDFLDLNSQYRGIGSGASGRFDIWANVWSLFLKNPVLGIGFRAHEHILGGSSHNGYLAVLVEIGGFGFISLLYFIVLSLLLLWRRVKDPIYTYSYSVFLGLCCCYLFLAMFERYLINVGNPTSLLFIVGLLSAVVTPKNNTTPIASTILKNNGLMNLRQIVEKS